MFIDTSCEIVNQYSMEDFLHYQTVNTSQGLIAFVDTGGMGIPVVFIHGNSCSSRVFKKQIAALKKNYRIIAIDLPGHGKSALPSDPEMAYTIPGYAEIIHEVIVSLDLGPCVMVGFSLGGNTTIF